MNIELIKSEIAKLSQLVASWESEAEISGIERDLALDKLKKLYDMVRFDNAEIEHSEASFMATAATSATAVSTDATIDDEVQSEEQEVEVEFLFAEDDDEADEGTSVELINEEQEEQERQEALVENSEYNTDTDSEIEIGTTEDKIATEPTEESTEELTEESTEEVAEQQIEQQIEQPAEPMPTGDESAKEEATQSATAFTGNLFGIEEPKRHTRSKHLRMMSIYNDSENNTQREKSVDISKIFDFGVDIAPAPTPSSERVEESERFEERVGAKPTPHIEQEEKSMTLADSIALNKQTLADTIATPAPLAEEITNTKISSLMAGVGINDKFLMIRDLFDGDDEAYEQAMRELDAQESFDDCMIYIVENFAWNPDSEGAKFIMKLLERKHA